ncbi:divalent metal cation transporter [Patescibacteria group bacterium]|jgi:Mn2+/Fe2+ NRAMP family transporter|nr:divalent metal cation transporter [Patescibacteria group bacterium]
MSFKRFKKFFGPGLVTGASDDDPSGIATYTQAGAAFGFATLWVALITIPFMTAVQEASARLALVTRRGIVKNLFTRVPRSVLAIGVLLFAAVNVFNLGADLGMMAASAQLLWGFPQWVWLVFFLVVILGLQTFLDYTRYARVLKWLCLSLLAYVIVAFTVRVDWMSAAFATFMPQIRFEKEYFLMLVALLGTTISPYLYVWQAAQEVEEEKADGCGHDHGEDSQACDDGAILYRRRADVAVGMGLSNVIAWFIILTAATVLFANGLYDVSTPAEAAAVLVPIAGKYASWLFTLGVIGTGLLAVPVLSGSAAYALSEVIGLRRYGLSSTWKEAKWFYVIVLALTVAGALTTLFGLNPIHALIYAAVGNALIAPLLILALIRLTEDKKVMGSMVNGPMSRVLLWGAFLLMTGSLVIWGILS